MSEVLKISTQPISEETIFKPALLDLWSQDRKSANQVADEMRSSEKVVEHESITLACLTCFTMTIQTNFVKMTIMNLWTVTAYWNSLNPPIQYGLEKSYLEENIYIESARFQDDIIFTLNNSKLFEFGALALASGIAASLALLPDGFDVAASLLLSAPLLVCICGFL